MTVQEAIDQFSEKVDLLNGALAVVTEKDTALEEAKAAAEEAEAEKNVAHENAKLAFAALTQAAAELDLVEKLEDNVEETV